MTWLVQYGSSVLCPSYLSHVHLCFLMSSILRAYLLFLKIQTLTISRTTVCTVCAHRGGWSEGMRLPDQHGGRLSTGIPNRHNGETDFTAQTRAGLQTPGRKRHGINNTTKVQNTGYRHFVQRFHFSSRSQRQSSSPSLDIKHIVKNLHRQKYH